MPLWATHDDAPSAGQHDLDPIVTRLGAARPRLWRRSGGRLGHDHGRNEARRRFRSISAQRATPSEKLGAGDAVSARGRGDEARTGQALQHDLQLLILRPAAAPAGLDDLKPPKGAVRMPVHTHCSQRQIACAARRPSPEAHGPAAFPAQTVSRSHVYAFAISLASVPDARGRQLAFVERLQPPRGSLHPQRPTALGRHL
jgi:hypothetical protein